MTLSGPVLVATDLSPGADEALRQGDALAHGLGARLVVCHVIPDTSTVRVLFPERAGPDPRVLAELERKARAAVHERVVAAIGRPLPDADVLIESDSADVGIRTVAQHIGAGVVALGPGPTAVRVAHHLSWSVLVARPAPPGGGVLAATDFSDPALPAIEVAVGESVRRATRLTVMHAVHLDVGIFAMPGEVMAPVVPLDATATLVERAEQRLRASLQGFHASGECHVAHGPAATCIIDAARTLPAALLVVGTHGHSGLRRWLLGSVAERVMNEAPCSVLVVPLGRQ